MGGEDSGGGTLNFLQSHCVNLRDENQEAMTREWMDKTIEEELSPLHKRIFELDASLSRKKQDFAK